MTSSRWPRYGAAAIGFAWYLYIGGGHTLNPLKIGWLLAGDWRQHWLGFLFFRREPWTFPLGTVTSLLYPVGTNIGFTDSNPLVSILLKPFSGWLPAEMQFVGPWLACCFVMQGYMGAALASTVTKHPWQQLLGGGLIALSPVLAGRVGHDTLCAQWFVLGLLYLGLREYTDTREAARMGGLAVAAALVSAAIHPYLAAMCWTLAHAFFIRLWRRRLVPPGRAVLMAIATTAGMLAVFGAIGYFGSAGVASTGFGVYSADLLTFIDPREFSRVLPDLGTASSHWEGLGCLGAGGVAAAVVALVTLIRVRPSLRAGAGWVIAASALMGVYALSANVTFADKRVLDLHLIYRHLEFITGPFRASGRFIWPLHYLVLLGGIWGMTRIPFSRTSSITAGLAILVALQAADYKPARWMLEEKNFRQAPVKDLAVAEGRYSHMAIYPMQVAGGCGGEYEEGHVYRYMLEAYRLKMTFNSGIFARLPLARTMEACAETYRAIEAGALDPQTLYIVSPSSIVRLKEVGAVCSRFDGDWVCVSRDSDETFRRYLETGKIVDPR